MCKVKIDFDEVIDRKNTNSIKYDFAVRRGKPENLLPLWVADMDFKISGKVLDALHERIDHGIFGYSEVQEEYFEAIRDWMEKKASLECGKQMAGQNAGGCICLSHGCSGIYRSRGWSHDPAARILSLQRSH